MEQDSIIISISKHRENESKYNGEIHKKQSIINKNNKNIMDYKNKIIRCKSTTTIKSYYDKISKLEANNSKLQKEVGNLQKKDMAEQKEINRLERLLLNTNSINNNLESKKMIVENSIVEDNISKKNYHDIINDFCKLIKREGLKTHYGIISNIQDSGNSGGNGRILFGKLNKHEVAIKILFNNEKSKINRFFDEFINTFMSLQKEKGIVELYLYEEYNYNGEIIRYIIMKNYIGNLSNNKPEVNESNTIKLFYDLCNIIKEIHKVNIVHRDIKPENILIDENNDIVLSDFGIAFFDPEEYQFTGHTLNRELLGNRKFSAPEQGNKGTEPHVTMDIFALGQITQWFVTGDTHSGTGRKSLSSVLSENTIYYLDKIIDKCLRANPKERYQNIDEIFSDLDKYSIKNIDNKKEEKTNYSFGNNYKSSKDVMDIGEKIIVI